MSDDGPSSWPQRGVHRVLGAAGPIAAELRRRGWYVAAAPPSTSDEGLWDGLVEALGLPGWFGRNLDALDEALGDLGRPTALVLVGWTAYARARPERWDRLLHVLHDRADHDGTPLVVLLTERPGDGTGKS